MFNQKWEKARLLLSDYPKSCDWSFLSSPVQPAKFVSGRQFLVWGMVFLLGGCSVDIIPLSLGGWHLRLVMPAVQASQPLIINVSSHAPVATPKVLVDSTDSRASTNTPAIPDESSNTPKIIPVPLWEKPTIQVPEASNKPERAPDPPKTQESVPAPELEKPAVLVPETSDEHNGQALRTYKSKMEETQNLLRNIDESQLTREQQDTFHSIHSFLEKAQEAFSDDDMSMAVNLAEKAHTLVKEIVKNSH